MCESKFSDPSSFLYLDMLADILMRDTLEMEVDFNKKMEFIKEQEQKVLENAKNVRGSLAKGIQITYCTNLLANLNGPNAGVHKLQYA